jgi:hypothetical protein
MMRGPAAAMLAGVLIFLALSAGAADISAVTAPYLAARERGAVGAVAGRAYEEARRTGEEPKRYAGVSVLLLPHSTSFERELAAIKAGRRESPERFLDADPKIRAARAELERALIEAGAGALLKGEMTDEAGLFRLLDVPEGAWTLLAWQETASRQKTPPLRRSDAMRFPGRPEVIGSFTVTYWLLPIDVRGGEETQVRLHDRNVWLTAIREDRSARDPEKRTAPGKQQGASPR